MFYLCKMKHLLLISLVAIGCSTPKSHIKHSDVTVVTPDTSKIWILNQGHGPVIYNAWIKGAYGNKTKVTLVDSIEFAQLCKKAVPCTCFENKSSNGQNVTLNQKH